MPQRETRRATEMEKYGGEEGSSLKLKLSSA